MWNFCIDEAKCFYKKTRKWISKSGLQKSTKGKYPFHSQSIQAVVHKYVRARDGIRKARKVGRNELRYPYKEKRNFNTKWANNGFVVNYEKGYIDLKLGNWQGKRQKPIRLYVSHIPKDIKEIELNYDKGLELCIVFDDGLEPKINENTGSCAIDLGQIHTITATCENGNSIIITGRKIRSLKQFRNKKQAELYKLMSKCKKDSRQWEKYRSALNYILSKSDKQILDALHKVTKNFVDFAVENSIFTVYIGKLEGV